MEFVDFLVGLWKWVGSGGGVLKLLAGVFWLAVFGSCIMC
jgi:hypothetical protein